jgi:PAS domain S-box-containing protein
MKKKENNKTRHQINSNIHEKLSDGFLICDANKKGYPIVQVSDGFCALTGYQRDEIIGLNCNFLQGELTSADTIQAIQNALNQKHSFRGKIINYRKDGSTFINLLRIEPIHNDAGEIIEFLGSQTNLSDIIEAELEELHIMKQIVEQAPVSIAYGELNHNDIRVHFQNKKNRKLKGDLTQSDNQSPKLHHSPAGFKKIIKKDNQVLQNNTKAIFDNDLITADQKTLQIKQRLFPLSRGHNHSQPLLANIMIDVTEEHQLLKQLQSMQLELQHSHEVLSCIGDTDKIGVFRADATGFIISADTVCEHLVNKKENELLGDAWMSALHPEDKQSMIDNWLLFTTSSSSTHTDSYRVLTKNNKIRTLKTHASKQYDLNNKLQGITGFVVDISEEIKAASNSAKYQSLWNNIHALLPIGVYEMNKDGSLHSCNDFMKNITGVDEHEAITQGWQKNVHPDDLERIFVAWTDFQTSDHKQPYIEELRLIVNQKIRHIRTICIAVYQDGETTGFIGCMWDITEKKQQHDIIKQQEQRIQLTENLSEIAYWNCDSNGQLTYYDWQGATLFGATDLSQLQGINWLNTIAKKDRQRVERHWSDFVSTATEDSIFEEQCHISTKKSQARIKVIGKGVFKRGLLQSFCGIITDITNQYCLDQRMDSLRARYQDLQEKTQTGSWEWDIENNTVWWSEETYRIFELDARQISASYENYMRCLTTESQQLVQSQVDQILIDGENYEHFIHIKSNPNKVLKEHGQLIRNTEGKPIKLFGTIQDITHQVTKENKAQKDTEHLHEVTEEIAQALNDIAQGNLDSKFSLKHKYHPILIACKQLRETLKTFSSEVIRVAKEVGSEGKLGGQANVNNVSGVWAELTENVNTMADNLTTQAREINQYAEYLADGVLDYIPNLKSSGEIKQLVDSLARVQSNIKNVLSTAEKISSGDYTSEVEPVSEYDVLGHAINNMTKSLKAKTEVLSQNAKLLDEFLLNARDIFIRLDPHFNVLYLSHSFYYLTENEFPPLIGIPVSHLSQDLSKTTLNSTFENESLKKKNDNHSEKTLRFKVELKNSLLILEAVFWPIRNIKGEIKEYHLLARNITEQVSAQDRNELLHDALSNMEPVFGVAKYPSQELVWMNHNHLNININDENSRKYYINEFHSIGQMSYFEKHILPIVQKENYWHGEWGMIDQNGNENKVFAQLTLHSDDNGQPTYLSTMFIDITDQQRQKEETEHRRHQINRLMSAAVVSEAASSLAHQLNQPLATISSTLQLWQTELKKNASTSCKKINCTMMRDIDQLVENTFNMGKLIHHVNSAVKRSEFVPEWCLLTDVISESYDNLPAISNNIQIHTIVSTELKQHKIFVDSILLTQILTNLITNSHDALQEEKPISPSIHIQCSINSNHLTIHFFDNAGGIPEDRAESVFEPFYSTKELGSGIGLAWIKSTLETMGGVITLKNNSDIISGAYFILKLPVTINQKLSVKPELEQTQ